MRRAEPLPSLVLLVGLALAGCTEPFAPPSRLDSLRVLAVHPEPDSGVPGEPVIMSMLLYDAREPAEVAEAPVDVVWLGGCHNPPGRAFYACYPLFHSVSGMLGMPGDPLPDTPVPGFFGVGSEFQFDVPSDILTSAPRSESDAIHYGVSYAFFAACAGELRLVDGPDNRLPLGCFDRVSNERLGSEAYVEGFTTLFSFEGNVNQNPVLSAVTFAGAKVNAGECTLDDDCSDVDSGSENFDSYGCSNGVCVPRVERCDPDTGERCPEYPIFPEIDPLSAEPDPGAPEVDGQLPGEILWVNFYADMGEFAFDTRLAHDRQTGFIDNRASDFSPLAREAGVARLFVTLHDNRGGAAWQFFEVLVSDP